MVPEQLRVRGVALGLRKGLGQAEGHRSRVSASCAAPEWQNWRREGTGSNRAWIPLPGLCWGLLGAGV